MHVTAGAGCHVGAVVTNALMELVAVRHHVAAARAAFAEARSAPNEWHRRKAVEKAMREIDGAEARLVALIEAEPGIEMRCRRAMVEVDGITGDVRAWAATIGERRAEVIDFPARRGRRTKRSRRRAENRQRVNENLHLVGDTAPTAC